MPQHNAIDSYGNDALVILVVLGRSRKARLRYQPARRIMERVSAPGHGRTLLDLGELSMPLYAMAPRRPSKMPSRSAST